MKSVVCSKYTVSYNQTQRGFVLSCYAKNHDSYVFWSVRLWPVKTDKITENNPSSVKRNTRKNLKRKKYLHVPPDLEYVRNNNFISILTCRQKVPENKFSSWWNSCQKKAITETSDTGISPYRQNPPVGRTVDQYLPALGKFSWPLNCVENRA